MACKKATLVMGGDGGDRIRSLPDEILCYVLSFLPTEDSVCTRLISNRWKHLFTFVPNLDFNFSHHRFGTVKNFIYFVDSIFKSYNITRMNKFNLNYLNYYRDHPDDFPISRWISSAILRHVRKIRINIHYISRVPVTMPPHLFSSKTLTSLKLIGFMHLVLPPPDLVCLPYLRTCFLSRVCFDDGSAKRLFRSCPTLEDLSLWYCTVAEGVELLDISSRTLKHLTLEDVENINYLVLDVPNLVTFKYNGSPPTRNFCRLQSLKKVVDAWISCDTESCATDGVVVELVRALCHVQKLTSTCKTMEAFARSGHSLPKFNNLTSLMFFPISSRSWMFLSNLLDNSPQLEFLTLYHGDGEDDGCEDDPDSYIFPECVPACVAQHLKEVEFQYVFTLDYHRKLINYFLKYAKNLKRMKISSNLHWNEQSNEQFEISSAEIVFHWDGGRYL